jgi:predicted secreted protein
MTDSRFGKRGLLAVGVAAVLAVLLWVPQPARAQGKQAAALTLKRNDYHQKKRVDKKVTLHVGQVQTIRLEVSAGTGYRWVATRKAAEVGVLTRKRAAPAKDGDGERPRLGRSTFDTYEFKATRAGKATLEFQFRPPGSKPAETTVRVTVVVSGDRD